MSGFAIGDLVTFAVVGLALAIGCYWIGRTFMIEERKRKDTDKKDDE